MGSPIKDQDKSFPRTGDVYAYDAADQLTNVLYNATNPDTAPSAWTNETTYSFDSAGNRTNVAQITSLPSPVTNVAEYVANNLNQYASVGGTNYTYDAKGNLTSDGVWTYGYDYENRLVSATSASSVVQYSYDVFGRLIERQTSGTSQTTNRMYYAGWQLTEERDGTGTLLHKYVYGPGIDEPVRMSSSGTNYYFHADALGSVTEITDVTGAVVESYTYNVYGTPTIYDSNGSPLSASAISNCLMFTARDRDPDTGLYNFRYRYYSPSLGRFVQPDPMGLAGWDLNLYRYAANNPVNKVDALGAFWDGSGPPTSDVNQPPAVVIYPPTLTPIGSGRHGFIDFLRHWLAYEGARRRAEDAALAALVARGLADGVDLVAHGTPLGDSGLPYPLVRYTVDGIMVGSDFLDRYYPGSLDEMAIELEAEAEEAFGDLPCP